MRSKYYAQCPIQFTIPNVEKVANLDNHLNGEQQ